MPPSSISVMYALKIDGAINFAPMSLVVKLAPDPTADIVFVPRNFIVILLPVSLVVTPGVNTCPKPGHALQVLTFTSVKALVDILNFVGSTSFLFAMLVPELFVIKSFGLTANKDVSLEALICFGSNPVLTE